MFPDTAALLAAAKTARARAYAPYSHFSVGAALLTENGKIYTGVNIENAAYPAGLCAERAAIAAAVSAGERHFSALAVAGDTPDCTPCGICRQVISEFCPPDFPIITEGAAGETQVRTIADLLPASFGPANIDKCQNP